MKRKKEPEQLSPELLQKLGEVKEERKELQSEEETLVEIAKETFDEVHSSRKVVTKNGKKTVSRTYSPKGCDFQAVLSEFECMDGSWKDVAEKFAKKHGLDKKLKKFVKSWPRKKQTQLDVSRKG